MVCTNAKTPSRDCCWRQRTALYSVFAAQICPVSTHVDPLCHQISSASQHLRRLNAKFGIRDQHLGPPTSADELGKIIFSHQFRKNL
ncbi:hypothetical protein PILCRDRAFT_297560 [Piloderma croceum F 1598]|uniref:Uncharacterized protein n=1 Tax=Piloderma croceum (strain F 1598) TaxID=765440 RepID=A0A0C3CBK0_PILCF|nr:hypothetical protein PILCRDRAFT_297560 [Piloderma croceum F 1598]